MVAPFSMILRPYACTAANWDITTVANIQDNVLAGAGDGLYVQADKNDDGATSSWSFSTLGDTKGFTWPIGYSDQIKICYRYASNFCSTFKVSYTFGGGTSTQLSQTTTNDSLYYDGSQTWALAAGANAFSGPNTDRFIVNIQAPASISSGEWNRFDYIYINLATYPLGMQII